MEKFYGVNNNVVYFSEEISDIIRFEGVENDVIFFFEGEIYVE